MAQQESSGGPWADCKIGRKSLSRAQSHARLAPNSYNTYKKV
jgi:hypothetical protein